MLLLIKPSAEVNPAPRTCNICGQPIPADSDAGGFCDACRNDPDKILSYLFVQAHAEESRTIGGYRCRRALGRGGMGQVWLAEETATGREVAVKLMLPKTAATQASRDLFVREALICGQLCHPNIVRQEAFGQVDDSYFIAMELCEGGSVEDLISANGPLSFELATAIILQVLDGLIYAHAAPVTIQLHTGQSYTAQGIVHRDLKPANILLAGSETNLTAKIADFGLAKAFETAGLSGHTGTGQLAGTPVYMPRQQIINYKYAHPAVDVWAAAACYYRMLTGVFPRDFKGGCDAIAAALTQPAIPIRQRNAAVPLPLADVIDQALREKPELGIQTVTEFKERLAKAL